MKYCPPSYVLCVSSHFWPFIIVKVVLEKLDKNLGSADPPPSVGPNSQIFPKIRFEGFPNVNSIGQPCVMFMMAKVGEDIVL